MEFFSKLLGTFTQYLRENVWDKEALLLKAAIKGTKDADPTSEIVLHVNSVGWIEGIQRAFYQYMMGQGVEFDLIGLSYYNIPYPAAGIPPQPLSFESFLQLCDSLSDESGKQVMVTECMYPSYVVQGIGPGYDGYSITEEGQASYFRDFIRALKGDPRFWGMIYFYPDYHVGIDSAWGATGLFHDDANEKLAMDVFVDALNSTEAEMSGGPKPFLLDQNFPNPFNPSTEMSFSLPKASHVKLEVYSIIGQKVATLTNEFKTAGTYRVVWDGRHDNGQPVSSGVYLYRLTAGGFTETKKMVLMK